MEQLISEARAFSEVAPKHLGGVWLGAAAIATTAWTTIAGSAACYKYAAPPNLAHHKHRFLTSAAAQLLVSNSSTVIATYQRLAVEF
jgi:hypothetical protein